MKTVIKVAVLLSVLVALAMGVALVTAPQVRQLREAKSVPVTGKAERTRTSEALDYSVATRIAAPAPIVWALLTDAKAYPSWNSTVVKLDGSIAKGQALQLVAKIAPERVFPLQVSEFEAPARMVWEDGGKAFLGVRTFTLLPEGDSTVFVMSETLSGRMLPLIEGSLPDFTSEFNGFAADLKAAAEKVAPPAVAP